MVLAIVSSWSIAPFISPAPVNERLSYRRTSATRRADERRTDETCDSGPRQASRRSIDEFYFPSTRFMVEPMSAGLLATDTPAAVSAAIFSAAVPFPPAMIAPA